MSSQGGYERSARFYDLFDDRRNIEFFSSCVRSAREVLDVGAGTGRIAVSLATKGARVWCVEPSPAMRAELEQKLDGEPALRERVTVLAGTARTFALDRTFEVCVLSGTFDHFVDRAERLASLTNIAKHLEPGGVLVFDVFLGLMSGSEMKPA
ncbi:MAG: class I SAM-dependent methyltransferase, partial [Candidatus Eisenbacteria sp.]|nr:class I SAM-dependent methyltransferase [Candidatus Eisenbacteria bacterium]